ncbi:putative mitochondrial ribosome protein [Schistosoma mansoni]|uniref:putative mitochondrial ribosome protein n=1 Tax=Schistosoma mansoni TaxID=6183 RepID=UPI0001A641BE|nr:putative mitochondrial ribosome protein [Schistosoma mansoni]|eukprot:XP_018648073.1 putative mitochondrial ribosome protein [Schistosoma mansoni]
MSGNVLPRAILHAVYGTTTQRFVPQLQRITLKCCKFRRDSQGVRDYIENHLVDFARDNPATAIYVKPRRNRPPLLVAEYLCGNWQYVRAKDMTCEEIANWINFLRTRSGVNIFPIYKYWSTKRPSIQGMWHPFYEPLYNQTILKTPNEIVRNIGQLCQTKQNELSAEEILLEKAKLQQYRLSDLSS